MNIIIAVTGGIAAYKACDLINMLRREKHDVRIIMTQHAKSFITPMTLATLSKHPVMDDMWQEIKGTVDHIDVAEWTELFIVYPATANIIGKFAHGIADDLLSTVFLALAKDKQKVIFPAMNTNMYENPIVQKNLKELASPQCFIAETRTGMLACGVKGRGCLMQPQKAMEILGLWFNDEKPAISKFVENESVDRTEVEVARDLLEHQAYIQDWKNTKQIIEPITFEKMFGYKIVYFGDNYTLARITENGEDET